jgi:hypothetical protein
MSQTFFSKKDPTETVSRLNLLSISRGIVTVWLKGQKEKHQYRVLGFHKDLMELALDSKDHIFAPGKAVLCSFELRGMSFFSEVIYQISISGHDVLQFKNILYKSERRTSYRLLTFPHYDVWAEFDIGEAYEEGNLIDFKTKLSQTGLFKSFLKLVEAEKGNQEEASDVIRIRVQDLSTTGMALHVGDLEVKFFSKDQIFKNMVIRFSDESILIPKVKIVYVIDHITSDRNIKKYKIGVHFENISLKLDDVLGKKINKLLRENDQNKDFENLIE